MCCFGISLLSQKKLASLLFSLWKHVLLGYRINNVYRFFTHLHSQQIGVIKHTAQTKSPITAIRVG